MLPNLYSCATTLFYFLIYLSKIQWIVFEWWISASRGKRQRCLALQLHLLIELGNELLRLHVDTLFILFKTTVETSNWFDAREARRQPPRRSFLQIEAEAEGRCFIKWQLMMIAVVHSISECSWLNIDNALVLMANHARRAKADADVFFFAVISFFIWGKGAGSAIYWNENKKYRESGKTYKQETKKLGRLTKTAKEKQRAANLKEITIRFHFCWAASLTKKGDLCLDEKV